VTRPDPAPTRRARSPQARGDETRLRILDETVACVCEEGFAAASAQRVAARAGVTWGVIQYHFGSRDGLLRAVVEHGFDGLRAGLERAAETGSADVDEVAEVAWRAFSAPASRAAMEVLVATRGRRTPETEGHLAAMDARMSDLGGALGQGRPARRAVALVWMCLRGMLLQRLAVGDVPDERRELALLVDAVRGLTGVVAPD